MIKIFTDGSTFNNGKKNASGGIGIYIPYLEFELSMPFLLEIPTNQKTELYAIMKSLEVYLTYVLRKGELTEEERRVNLYTDSEYSIKCVTSWIKGWKRNGWKTAKKEPVKNLEFIKPIENLMNLYENMGIKLSFIHLNSHQKEPRKGTEEWEIWKGNDKVDGFAVKGSKEFQKLSFKVMESVLPKEVEIKREPKKHLKTVPISSFFRN